MPAFKGISSAQLVTELLEVWKLVEIEIGALDPESPSARDFVACVIFLLEPCHLLVNGQTLKVQVSYGHSIHTTVSYESARFMSHFARLPILALYNVNTSIPLSQHGDLELSKHVARRHKSGALIAISYANDEIGDFTDRDEYGPGEAFPLTPA